MPETATPATGRNLQIGMFLPSGGDHMMGGKNPHWDDLLAMTRRAEEVGFDFISVLDHFELFWEGWSVLAALAASTSRITLISYVTCTGYRNPGLVAKIVDTVDEISGGRLILGLGAGDDPAEHVTYGYPNDKLVSRFEEAANVITTLLREGRITHEGTYYTLRDCELRPRGPRPQGPPILIGSLGGKRMQRITAELADIWSGGSLLATRNNPSAITPLMEQVDAACHAAGRDPASLARMFEAVIEFPGGRTATWTDIPPITGTPAEIAAHLRICSQLGVDYVQVWLEPNNLEGIEQFAPAIEVLRAAG